LYISRSKLGHSVNAVYVKGLRANNVDVCELFVNRNEYFDLIRYLFKHRNSFDTILVGYDSPQLVIFCRLFTRKKIIYNALCSVYERLIVSRGHASPFSVKAVYYWLLDFSAVYLADLVILESDHQIDYFNNLFKISKYKLYKGWTGVNEDNFYYNPSIPKSEGFTVLFRGAFMPESGVEYAIRAAKVLEDNNIKFVIIGGGILLGKVEKLLEELKPANLELITDLSYEKLREIMQKCHLSLGQLSDHNRLTRTIPHKAYESLAMNIPYLTASNSGILELLTPDETCLTCDPADAKSLAEKILWAQNNYSIVEKIAENSYKLYQDKLRSSILAKNLLNRI
ncbi:MAG: glycosyltransferase, partial [bacterium]|nr:glycosyltransferase [bacterium]